MTSSEILNTAADYLEENGWCQGAFSDGSSCCAIGAIRMVTSGDPGMSSVESANARIRLSAYLSDPDCPAFPIFDWNDFAGRTREDVIEAMREAAK